MNCDATSHLEKVNDFILLPLLLVASKELADHNRQRIVHKIRNKLAFQTRLCKTFPGNGPQTD